MNDLRFRLVEDDDDFGKVLQLRREVLVNEFGRIKPGEETDDYDGIAEIYYAHDNGQPLGTLRIVRDNQLSRIPDPSTPSKFSIEKKVDISGLKDTKRNLVELSRLVVPREYRNRLGLPVTPGLFACVYAHSIMFNDDDALMIANCEMDYTDEIGLLPYDERVRLAKIPVLYTMVGFRPIGDIREPFYYDNFGVCSAPMLLKREDLPEKFKPKFEKFMAHLEIGVPYKPAVR